MNKRVFGAGLCVLLSLGLLAVSILSFRRAALGPELPSTPSPSQTAPTATPRPSTPSPSPTLPSPVILDDGLPHDKLFITVERQGYESGGLQLLIPKLKVEVPVLAGVDEDSLLQGVGLYDFAQLPGEGNRNVSIAGHRNGIRNGKITDNMPFYYLDTLEEGDALYLRDDTSIYQYVYHDQEVVEEDDWGPIYSQGFSCLTLTTCTPIGISDHRLILRGELHEILPLTEDYDYPSTIKEASQP